MDYDEIVARIIAEQCCMDMGKVTPEKRLREDLQMDSLDLIECAIALSQEFDLGEISSVELDKMITVQDVFDYVGKGHKE